MIYLTNAAVKYAVDICIELENYKVVIACNRVKGNQVFDKLLSNVNNDDILKVFKDTLCFKNGSVIKIISASDSARGNKAHLLIVDIDIEEEVVDTVLRPMEIWNYYKYHSERKLRELQNFE